MGRDKETMKKRPLVIGPLCFEYPFVLAPLAGITDKAMRSLCSQAGASLTYTEMVSAKGLWYGDRKTGELLEIGSQEGPVGFQLFGSEPGSWSMRSGCSRTRIEPEP